jgi:hypothetical protein
MWIRLQTVWEECLSCQWHFPRPYNRVSLWRLIGGSCDEQSRLRRRVNSLHELERRNSMWMDGAVDLINPRYLQTRLSCMILSLTRIKLEHSGSMLIYRWRERMGRMVDWWFINDRYAIFGKGSWARRWSIASGFDVCLQIADLLRNANLNSVLRNVTLAW